jgi:hypothetical protein
MQIRSEERAADQLVVDSGSQAKLFTTRGFPKFICYSAAMINTRVCHEKRESALYRQNPTHVPLFARAEEATAIDHFRLNGNTQADLPQPNSPLPAPVINDCPLIYDGRKLRNSDSNYKILANQFAQTNIAFPLILRAGATQADRFSGGSGAAPAALTTN